MGYRHARRHHGLALYDVDGSLRQLAVVGQAPGEHPGRLHRHYSTMIRRTPKGEAMKPIDDAPLGRDLPQRLLPSAAAGGRGRWQRGGVF